MKVKLDKREKERSYNQGEGMKKMVEREKGGKKIQKEKKLYAKHRWQYKSKIMIEKNVLV